MRENWGWGYIYNSYHAPASTNSFFATISVLRVDMIATPVAVTEVYSVPPASHLASITRTSPALNPPVVSTETPETGSCPVKLFANLLPITSPFRFTRPSSQG